MPETRSNALDSSIPASLAHISNTYPMLGVPSVEVGGGPGVECWYAESGWWRRLEKGCAERGADWVKNECCSL